MNDITYPLPGALGILNHFPVEPVLLRDHAVSMADENKDDSFSELLMQARIRSGDYMPTLATELDRIAASARRARLPEAAALEHLVAELLYLDKHYDVQLKRHS